MKTKYYAWKDGQKTECKQDWREITQDEFIKICSANRKLKQEERRYFYQLPGLEDGDYYLFLECNYEQYKESRAERYKRIKKVKELEELEKEGYLYQIVSLDTVIDNDTGDSFTLHDLVADPDSDFEDGLILSMDIHSALSILTPDELDIIERLYLSEFAVSEKELAKMMNVPRRTLGYQKEKILKKLRGFFATP